MIVSQFHLDALTDDDVLVVRDFLDTKATVLLAREAHIGEWRFEYAEMKEADNRIAAGRSDSQVVWAGPDPPEPRVAGPLSRTVDDGRS